MESYFAGNETYDTRGQRVLEFYFNSTGKLHCKKARAKITPPSLLPEYGMVSKQTGDLTQLLGAAVFSNPKPVAMMRDFVSWFCAEDEIVVDFFAGSGTMAHAVMAQNVENDSDCRYIIVQFPEPLSVDDRDQAASANYCAKLGKPKNLSEITKERLRRASKKIQEENPESTADLGFRLFKLDSSNIKAWEPDPDDLEQSLLDHLDHIKEGRTEQDILYEVLLKRGIDLCAPIETREFAGKPVSAVDSGALIACLAEKIDTDEVEEIALGIVQWRDEMDNTDDTAALFRDSAFADDVAKANCTEILRQHGVKNVQSV